MTREFITSSSGVATFLASPCSLHEQPHATYIISGERLSSVAQYENGNTQVYADARDDQMEVDSQEVAKSEQEVGGDLVPQIMMKLVGQNELDGE